MSNTYPKVHLPDHPRPARTATRRQLLPKPRSLDGAAQCRELGLAVGDTLVGRETYSTGAWTEAKLTLLWVGAELAVWKVQRRSNVKPHWRVSGEQSNWTLNCRDWYQLTTA